MGGCLGKTLTINTRQDARLRCIQPFVFSVTDAEIVLKESEMGDYLLYRDHITDQIMLSVRYNSHIRHHRIAEQNGLFYLNGQPYPYLDSIVLYHRKHKLDALKLTKQAHLSARIVRLFAHKIHSANGNNLHTVNNEQLRDNNNGREEIDVGSFSANHLANGLETTTPPFFVDNQQLSQSPSSSITRTESQIRSSVEIIRTDNTLNNGVGKVIGLSRKNSSISGTTANMASSKSVTDIDIENCSNEQSSPLSLANWTLQRPDSKQAGDFNGSTVGSQVSLLSRSSSTDSRIQIERF